MASFAVGTRVRVKSLSHVLCDPGEGPLYGTVEAPDEADYYEVRLDRRIRSLRPSDGAVWVAGVVVLDENLEVLPTEGGSR